MNAVRCSEEPDAQLVIWPGRALYVGRMLENQAHAHHAIQLSIALDDLLSVQTPPDSRWSHCRAVVTAANQRHRLRCEGRVAQIYLDPESGAGAALHEWMAGAGIRPLERADLDIPSLAIELLAGWQQSTDHHRLTRLVDRVLGHPGSTSIDPRVRLVLDVIHSSPGRHCGLPALAAKVALSPNRLGALFRRDIGIPVRRYLLWLRLIDAIKALSAGANLTEAAHRAGFSDSAHLSRTCRRMFGIPPSALTSGQLTIHDDAGGSPAAPWWSPSDTRR